MKKSWTKRNTTFLNTPSSGCMAGVMWRVEYHAPKAIKKSEEDFYDAIELLNKNRAKARMNGSIRINTEAQEHYVHSKSNLRVLRNMRRELDAFEGCCEQALLDVEEANAES